MYMGALIRSNMVAYINTIAQLYIMNQRGAALV